MDEKQEEAMYRYVANHLIQLVKLNVPADVRERMINTAIAWHLMKAEGVLNDETTTLEEVAAWGNSHRSEMNEADRGCRNWLRLHLAEYEMLKRGSGKTKVN